MEDVKINDYEAKMVPLYLEPHHMIYLYCHAVSESLAMFVGVIFRLDRILVDSDPIYLTRMVDTLDALCIIPKLRINDEWYKAIKELPKE